MTEQLRKIWQSLKDNARAGGILSLTIFLSLFALILFVRGSSQIVVDNNLQEVVYTTEQGVQFSITAETAQTPQQQYQGLRFRQSMPQNNGMLFIFDPPQPVTFTMQETFISLDMIMMNSNMQVVQIYQNTDTNQTRVFYPSGVPVTYVLETNAGWVERSGVSVGDFLSIR